MCVRGEASECRFFWEDHARARAAFMAGSIRWGKTGIGCTSQKKYNNPLAKGAFRRLPLSSSLSTE